MKRFVLSAMLLFVAMSPALAEMTHVMTPHELSIQDSALVEQAVKDRLKDPDSAKFSGLSATASEAGSVTVCGFVNAKNSFGGYTGRSPFMGVVIRSTSLAKFFIISMGSSTSDEKVTRMMCEKDKVVLQ